MCLQPGGFKEKADPLSNRSLQGFLRGLTSDPLIHGPPKRPGHQKGKESEISLDEGDRYGERLSGNTDCFATALGTLVKAMRETGSQPAAVPEKALISWQLRLA